MIVLDIINSSSEVERYNERKLCYNKRMKIGVFDPYMDDIGGGEKYMMTIASCLSQQHDVTIFWDNKKDISTVAKRFGLSIEKITLAPNIFSSSTSFFNRLFISSKFDYFIVLSDGSFPFLLSKKLLVHFQQPLMPMRTMNLWERIKQKRIANFFCNSIYTKLFIEKKFHINASVIYPPVALYLKNAPRENIILHVGRFRPINEGKDDYKKQAIMIEVFKELIKTGLTNWKFVLVISIKEEEKEIFEKIKKNAEGYPIYFLINKTREELGDMYAKARIYWHASGFGEDLEKYPAFAEHFGISTVEAMSAGVVPVVINAGGQKEIVQHRENGLLWNNLDELKQETLDLIQDPILWGTLSEQAKKTAKLFSEETFYKKIYQLLR